MLTLQNTQTYKSNPPPTTLGLLQSLYAAVSCQEEFAKKSNPLQFEKDNVALSVATLRYQRDRKTLWTGKVENRLRELIDVFLYENE